MKKYILFFSLSVLGLLSTRAQENSIKLNWTSFSIYGNFGLNYERKFTDNISVNARVNMLIPRALPYANYFETAFSGDVQGFDFKNNFSALKMSSYGIHPQFRYYTKGDALDGFYVVGSMGYQRSGISPFEFDFQDANDANLRHGGEIALSNSFFGVGAGIGTQWVTRSGFTFDIIWISLGSAFGSTKIVGKSDDPGVDFAQIQDDFNEEMQTFEGVNYLRKFSSSYTDNSISLKFKHIMPYTKLLNFSIGYSF